MANWNHARIGRLHMDSERANFARAVEALKLKDPEFARSCAERRVRESNPNDHGGD